MKLTFLRRRISHYIAVLAVCCSICHEAVGQSAAGAQIYKCQDEAGRTYFCSDVSQSREKKVADLPQIGRENLDSKIAEIRNSKLETCKKHGGDKCEFGPDTDGSVICADGYRQSALSFTSTCNEAKLQILSSSMLEDGNVVLPKDRYQSITKEQWGSVVFQLSVRNLSAVTVRSVRAYFETQRIPAMQAVGPETIEPYGSAEYQLRAAGFSSVGLSTSEIRYRIACGNCVETSGYAFRR